jgi:ABC-type multidrug transport system permease subunit
MNEAERCDRISLMHQGRVLAVDAPKELVKERGSTSLEDAFISYLEEATQAGEKKTAQTAPQASRQAAERPPAPQATPREAKPPLSRVSRRFDPGRMWAYARRETMELLRDPIRLAFAFVGPVALMFAMGYGITFDVEHLKYAAFDQDQTPQSRRLLESFSGSRYFTERPPIGSADELEQRMRSGELAVAVEIPSGFGRDVASLHSPEAAFWIDGAMPFRGETTKGYVTGLALRYAQDLIVERVGPNAPSNVYFGSVNIENRFRYNQAFKSVFSMVPSVIILVLIPAIMATIGVVREKETGSIANFRSTPISKFEFLMGKQFPYVVVGMLAFILMVLMAFVVFQVPVKGSFGALALGTLLYVFSTCGFGQLISTFTRTQVAAVFATSVIAIIPTVNFSGLLVPVSSLTGAGRLIGLMFPMAWFQPISVGTFTKELTILISGSMLSRLQALRSAILLPLTYCCGNRRAEMSVDQTADSRQQPAPHVTKAKRSGSHRFAKLRLHVANIYRLTIKELRSFRSDPIMLLLVAYAFTVAIYAAATGASTEATNLSVGIVDEDHSDLSRRIADGLTPPTFQRAVEITAGEIDPGMDSQRFMYVIEITTKFQADILAGRRPTVQINVDATAAAQAANGMTYIQNVILNYVTGFVSGREGWSGAPVKVVTRAKFNPNFNTSWFTSVMQIVSNLTMITVMLTGAALIREREQGTVEHLLVMPVVPAEIMLSKILANGMVVLLATTLSLAFVVE